MRPFRDTFTSGVHARHVRLRTGVTMGLDGEYYDDNQEDTKQLEMAGGRGFEPLLAESESAVLPLDEPPIEQRLCIITEKK